jgi:copper/silver efflux system protein
VKDVRGFSDFGYPTSTSSSTKARTFTGRARARWNTSPKSPAPAQGVQTELGPDATGVGWVFQYALVDTTGKQSLADCAPIRTGTCATTFESVPGVAEVAPLGGFVRQYQVNVDPKAASVQHSHRAWWRRCAPATTTWADAWWNSAARIHGARARLCALARRHRNIVLADARWRAHHASSDVARWCSAPTSPRHGRLERQGRRVGGIVIMRQGENALR